MKENWPKWLQRFALIVQKLETKMYEDSLIILNVKTCLQKKKIYKFCCGACVLSDMSSMNQLEQEKTLFH